MTRTKAGYKIMRFIKHNFVFIFLAISSIAMGVIALTTALRLREFKNVTPAETQALTPACKLIFTIENTTPRQIANKSETPITSTITTTTTISLSPVVTPTTLPKIGGNGITQTPTPKITSTPTPTTALVAQKTNQTPTPTISKVSPTVTKTLTPTKVKTASPTATIVAPQLPVSGIFLPTVGVLFFGLLLFTSGALSRKQN